MGGLDETFDIAAEGVVARPHEGCLVFQHLWTQ